MSSSRLIIQSVALAAVLVLLVVPTQSVAKIVDTYQGYWVSLPLQEKPALVEIATKKVRSTVTVLFDKWGVPHVYASNEDDLHYAVGYVQAMDRLFQMDLARRAGLGKLSEIFGQATVEDDKLTRTIGLHKAAQKTLEALTPIEKRVLEHFSEGVNDYIDSLGQRFPLEYVILGVRPERWSPIDTVAIGKLMAWTLSGSFSDLAFSQISQRLGREFLEDVGFLDRPLTISITGAPNGGESSLQQPEVRVELQKLIEWLQGRVSIFGSSELGSNNWVVSGKLTENGYPMLANDPHLALLAPPIWYEIHMVVTGQLNVRGSTFPGVPVVALGRNERITWGFTNVGADVVDFYQYVFSKDGRTYLYKGKWVDLTVEDELIKVKDRADIKLKVSYTVHGPIVEREGNRVAMQWTGHLATGELRAIYGINRARNINEFRDALRNFHVPAQNVVYADVEGNIAYWAAGLYPIRAGAPYLVFNGSRGEGEWTGFIPFEEIPHTLNPSSGFIVTANNKPVGSGYPHYLGYGWADRFRAGRITQLLKELRPLSTEDMMKIQNDAYFSASIPFLKMLLKAYEGTEPSGLEREILGILRNWDGYARKDGIETTVLSKWLDELSLRIAVPLLEKTGIMGSSARSFRLEFLEKLLLDDNRRWIPSGSRTILIDSFRGTLQKLTQEFGTNPSDWKWGGIHHFSIEHPMGSVLEWLNYGRLPADGAQSTVNPAGGLRVKSGASWRHIVSLDPKGEAWSVLPGGQSGHRFSRNWDDQLQMWLQGRYKAMSIPATPEAVEDASARVRLIGS